ncbi:MAG TPA: N-acetylmuramoyl-L-alanine amidase [Chitinophagaceae bacterium]|nr:N-acetylmuramoyl-L-alanine amidase [Chitinophagaceae bacterium]
MLRRTLTFFLIVTCCITLFSFEKKKFFPAPAHQKSVRTIIVDAGHGIMANGGHNGAKGSYSWEDEICLAVSKELIGTLNDALPDVKVVETRPTSSIVALHRRAEIANANKGDLFVCIHVNAARPTPHSELTGYKTVTSYVGKGKKRKKVTRKVPQYRRWTTPSPAKGTETYIWGAHKNDDKEVAMRENAELMEESNYKETYGDIDPSSPEFIALSLLKTKQYFKRSATLAGFVQDELAKIGRIDRDVRQRGVGIWVLQATAMPSILVETGYITNREEEDYLNSKKGQQEIAESVTRAIITYIAWLEKQKEVSETEVMRTEIKSGDADAFLKMVEQKEKKSR